MSYMLTGYSEHGCQEFILPEIDNSNYTLTLDSESFGSVEDVCVYLDVLGGIWRFRGISDNGVLHELSLRPNSVLKAGDTIQIYVGVKHIALVVMEFEPDINAMEKFRVKLPCQISFGSEADNIIICTGNPLLSRHHSTLNISDNSCTLTDTSTNGTFINNLRVHGTVPVSYGQCIQLFGVQIVWLGDIIAVSSKCGNIRCKLERYPVYHKGNATSNERASVFEKHYFRRSPRNLPKLFEEKIEIEGPPQMQKSAKRPLLLTIGPSLTMALPMLVGTGIAIWGTQASGASASIYMYTGIIIAVLSAIIGSTWTVVNLKYTKKQEAEAEAFRKERYQAYIAAIEEEISEKYTYNEQSLNYIYPDSKTCAKYDKTYAELWNRNTNHADFLYFRLGTGELPFRCQIAIPHKGFSLTSDDLSDRPKEILEKYAMHRMVPVGVDLKDKTLVGIVSLSKDRLASLLRNLAIQIAANTCYTDVKMVFLFNGSTPSEKSIWEFAKWLPHTWSPDHKIRYYASNDAELSEVCFSLAGTFRIRAEKEPGEIKSSVSPYYIVFVSQPDLLENEPISKYLYNANSSLGVTTILFADRAESLPNACVNIIEYDDEFAGVMNTERGDSEKKQILFDDVDAQTAEEFARAISSIEVRETESGGEIPETLDFLGMYHVRSIQELNIADRWLKNKTYENMRVPIGEKAGGSILNLDIHEKYHGPHGLVAGTTGSGKSETLQTFILSLAVNFSPVDIAFFLIDFKGGGMANLFAKLPHTAGSISNLSGSQIRRAMVSIKSENRRRQRIFSEYGVNHIDQYTRLVKSGEASTAIPHLFIIIDEFAELKHEEPDFMRELISVAQVGRSLGVHLILATQKPSGTVDENIWSNTRFKLCLRVQDRQDSNDVLHKPDAAYLTQAGRCYMQVGNDEIYELFQSAWSGAIYDDDLSTSRVDTACMWTNTGRPAVLGNMRSTKYYEKKRLEWLSTLLTISNSVNKEGVEIPSDGDDERLFLDLLYRGIHDSGYDYVESATNSMRALDFLRACAQIEKRSNTNTETATLASEMLLSKGKKLPELKEKTQLSAIVSYLDKLANKQLSNELFRLWLPILPQELFLFDISNETSFDGEKWPSNSSGVSLSVPIGLYDDPANQTQDILTIDFVKDGNLAVCGAVASGKSTFLQTLLFALVNKYSPEQVTIYCLDYSNHLLAPFEAVAHVGGVVFDDGSDRAEKLFVLISKTIIERKSLFQGGSYSQYVRASKEKLPYIVVAIDNYASFREKTENRFESDLMMLAREGANYGIYLAITAGGFGAVEIQNRLADNFRSVICLEMGDRFKYSEVMRNNHLEVVPESNVKGRGIANVNGSILEFQTALAIKALDDYDRANKLNICFTEMNRVWAGKCARKIPTIPSEPTWEDLASFEDGAYLGQNDLLPFGWYEKDATIACVDLSQTYCWLISGRSRTGKSNLIKVMASSASKMDSIRYIFDFSNNTLRKFAGENNSHYISTGKELFVTLKEILPLFKERNIFKNELLSSGLTEREVFERMQKFSPIFLFIDNLIDFINIAYQPPEDSGQMSGFLENIAEKGFLHNIYIIAAIDYSKMSQILGNRTLNFMTSYRAGIHLGGNVAAQRIFEFASLPYSEQSKVTKPGKGLLPSDEYRNAAQEVVIPLLKG